MTKLLGVGKTEGYDTYPYCTHTDKGNNLWRTGNAIQL